MVEHSNLDMDSTVPLRQLLQSTEIQYSDMNSTTMSPENSTQLLNSCDYIDYNYDIAVCVISVMLFIFGIIYTFFGKPLFYI